MNDIEHVFVYHPPQDNQVNVYQNIREMGKRFAQYLDNHIPEGEEKKIAIEKLREVVMWSNAAVACEKK